VSESLILKRSLGFQLRGYGLNLHPLAFLVSPFEEVPYPTKALRQRAVFVADLRNHSIIVLLLCCQSNFGPDKMALGWCYYS